ncbi:hypothetical protein BJX68DRAFT_232033 [Aspergillus pseudodeflectus]|uniref:Uncharacterized protein n=1 Tax=Aspergillus pseudodeflectus TaxID=176178 RepID=A0ABR4KQL5_9EURO
MSGKDGIPGSQVIQEIVSVVAFGVNMPTLICCRGLHLTPDKFRLILSTLLYLRQYFSCLVVEPTVYMGGIIISIRLVQSQARYILFQTPIPALCHILPILLCRTLHRVVVLVNAQRQDAKSAGGTASMTAREIRTRLKWRCLTSFLDNHSLVLEKNAKASS